MDCEYLQVLTTAGSEQEAQAIAAALVERRLAAGYLRWIDDSLAE